MYQKVYSSPNPSKLFLRFYIAVRSAEGESLQKGTKKSEGWVWRWVQRSQ